MRKLILSILAIAGFVTANAQYLGNKITDNVSFGILGGVYTPMDLEDVFPLNSSAEVFLQKELTPISAFRVEGSVMAGTNYQPGKTFIKTVNVGGDYILNLSNLFAGFNVRSFDLKTVTGLGWMHYYGSPISQDNYMYAKTGLDFVFNLGKKKAWQFIVEPNVYWNLTAKSETMPKFNKHFAELGLMAGIAYKFKTSNGTHNFIKARLYDQEEVTRLTKTIGQLRLTNNDLKAQLAAASKKETTVINNLVNPVVVYFAKGSSELSEEAKNLLKEVKSDKGVTISGYASPEGTKEFNDKLSQDRASEVAKYLIGQGIKINKVQGFGVASETSNRVVIIRGE